MSRLGKKVKELRIAKGLSPKALGKKAGVSESFVLEVEDGRRILNESLANRLSKVLGSNLNENGDFYTADQEPVKAAPRKPITEERQKPQQDLKSSAPAPQWEHAFSSIIKDVPVFDQNMTRVVTHKKLVLQDNKVEGIPADKAFYIQLEEEHTAVHKLKKGDLVLLQKAAEIQSPGVYLIHYQNALRICEVKPLNSSLLLIGSGRGTLTSETAAIKDVTIMGRCIKAEVRL